ncbi:hypothetical protein [Domibacillus aminovorans]|uniref:Uncharacterized protein n=1 Tax=Domibacillus aminovorans TaxID=29332 RepID=A0A177LAM2_9BACI|nr:hypothetical protein [Domibacillus aminovorans]OAH62357.1 hypothetical protein AWH49_10365 [Domibacillus aminovorans]
MIRHARLEKIITKNPLLSIFKIKADFLFLFSCNFIWNTDQLAISFIIMLDDFLEEHGLSVDIYETYQVVEKQWIDIFQNSSAYYSE